MSDVPKQGTQIVLKLQLKLPKREVNIKLPFLDSGGKLSSLFRHPFNLRWTVTLDHLRSYDLFRCILVYVLNVNNLIIHSKGWWDCDLDLDRRKVYIWEKGDSLLSEVIKAFTVLRLQ